MDTGIVTVTYEDALGLLQRQVEKKGADYIYTDHYEDCELAGRKPGTDEAEPRCIVGHVYADLGVPVIDLVSIYGTVGCETVRFDYEYGIRFEQDAIDLLRSAQREQDGGMPWGDAVKHAQIWARPGGQ